MVPDESGAGSQSLPWAFNVVEVAQKAAGDVVTELSSFTSFQKRVDELIRNLKGSPAGPGELGQERLARDQFGGGAGAFTEASGLFTSYETVITELENLSRLLADSIEGMGIAVLASHNGYQNIDAETRDRMTAISVETKKHYGGEYNPEHAKPKDNTTPPTGDTGGTA